MARVADKITAYEYLINAIKESNSEECMLWPFRKDSDGYGRVTLPVSVCGKGHFSVGAHRLAYKIVNGEWPEPMGLHICDNPTCFNPKHIYAGGNRENKDDQIARGRTTKGTQQRDAKLTEETVAEARKKYLEENISVKKLSKEYGVSEAGMANAIRGKRTWRHVANPVDFNMKKRVVKTHCIRGHELVDGSYYASKVRPSFRQCKECTVIREKRRNAECQLA